MVSISQAKAQRASYADLGDACATAHAMELIGARWTYPILRELMLGPKRFNALMASVRGITPAVLTARLRELVDSGLVVPPPLDAPSVQHSYSLTPWALELAPILRQLGRWEQSSRGRRAGGGLTPDAVVQAMITMVPDEAPTRPLHVHLELFDERTTRSTDAVYCIEWTAKGFDARRPPCTEDTAVARCDSSRWGRVLFGDLDLDDSGVEFGGSAAAVRTLVRTFRRRH